MGYYIDLESISIDEYKAILKSTKLLPSWQALGENIDKNLDIFKSYNMLNIDQILKKLKKKSELQVFSKQSGLSENYLNLLRRVINGYKPKPNKIKDFRGIPQSTVAKLESLGLKNTRQLYPEILTPKKRTELGNKTGTDKKEILKLTKLTDLSRIRWVGHTFAYVLLKTGYDTAQKVANADYKTLYLTIKQLNKDHQIFKGNIGENDMKLCVDAAKCLDFEITY